MIAGRRRLCFSLLATLFLSSVMNINIDHYLVNGAEVGSGSLLHDRDIYCDNSSNDEKTAALYFLVVAPYPDSFPFSPSWRGGPAVTPAAIVAKDLINNRSDILKDYRIEFIVHDSGCNQTSKAVNSVIRGLFFSNKNIVGIIGPGCSEATLAIAPLVTDDKISLIQIAPSATSPVLTNTTLYPNTFRPIVSALGVVDTYIEIIRRMSYRHVGALYEANRPFQTTVYTQFQEKAQQEGIKLTAFGLFDSHFPLNEFHNKVRVIFVFASSGFARQLLCLAYHKEMLYPDYQFIFSNRRPKNFLKNVTLSLLDGDPYKCSPDIMANTVIGMIFNDFRLTRRDRTNSNTDVGLSYDEFNERYTKVRSCHLKLHELNDAVTTEHHSGYFDATWALALSLNNSLPHLKERELSLSNYTHQMPEITDIIKEQLLNLSFEGIRGRVEFSRETHDGANVTLIDMYQVFDISNTNIVGFYNPDHSTEQPLTLYDNVSLIQAEFDQMYITPHISLGVIVVTAVAILFATLLAFHIANVVWGNRKSVKASSPNINHLIFSGCYLALVGAIVYTNAFVFIDISVKSNIIIPVHCSTLQWTSTLTFSLVFGTLSAKTWRIHRIFNRFNASPMKRLGDKILISIALTPLAIDVILNILWNLIDPWYISVEQGSDLAAEVTCKTDNVIMWSVCVSIPKGVLTLVVLYLSIRTRRVHKREFKQTKSINILIYSLLILSGIILPLFFILQSMVSHWAVSLRYLCFCLFDLAYVIMCIALVLLPPLLPPIKEKLRKWFNRPSSSYWNASSYSFTPYYT